MSGNTVEVHGLNRTRRQFKKLGHDLGPAIKKMNLEAATIVKETALARVPVGTAPHDKHPGKLRASIRAGATLSAGVVRAGRAATPYAPAIHWGWAKHHIRPQPFLYQALDARRAEVVAIYEKQLEALIETEIHGEGGD